MIVNRSVGFVRFLPGMYSVVLFEEGLFLRFAHETIDMSPLTLELYFQYTLLMIIVHFQSLSMFRVISPYPHILYPSRTAIFQMIQSTDIFQMAHSGEIFRMNHSGKIRTNVRLIINDCENIDLECNMGFIEWNQMLVLRWNVVEVKLPNGDICVPHSPWSVVSLFSDMDRRGDDLGVCTLSLRVTFHCEDFF